MCYSTLKKLDITVVTVLFVLLRKLINSKTYIYISNCLNEYVCVKYLLNGKLSNDFINTERVREKEKRTCIFRMKNKDREI